MPARLTIIIALLLALTTACTPQEPYPSCTINPAPGQQDKDELTINRLIVLPTSFAIQDMDSTSPQAKALATGSRNLTRIIGEYLSCRANVLVLSEAQEESYAGSFMGQGLERARYIGMQAGGDAVLISTINRFRQLEGGEYGAKSPASVAFDYQLIHLKSGSQLCKGSYQDTQQPLLSNILSLPKARQRNFKFVTASTLLREGVNEKFADCSHLRR